MTEQLPLYLQNKGISAKRDRQLIRSMFAGLEQVLDGLVVTAAAGYNTSIAAGRAVVQGDTNPNQGMYHVFNDAAVTKTHTPDPTNPKIDRIVFRVFDSVEVGSGTDQSLIDIVSGTPVAGASLTNPAHWPALPGSAIPLARVRVPPSGGSLSSTDIANESAIGGGGGGLVTSLPGSPFNGQIIYFQDSTMAAEGVVWTLRYNIASAGPRWEYVGGSARADFLDALFSTASASLVQLSTLGVSVPLPGTYDVEFAAELNCADGSPGENVGLGFGGTSNPTGFPERQQWVTTVGFRELSVVKHRYTGLVAGTFFPTMRKIAGTGNVSANRPEVWIRPVRVG